MQLAEVLKKVPIHLLQDELARRHRTLPHTARAVLSAVAEAWEADADEIRLLSTRELCISHPRQAAMVLLRARGFTLIAIGQVFGGRDHGTVMHAIRTHPKRMADPNFAARFELAKRLLPDS